MEKTLEQAKPKKKDFGLTDVTLKISGVICKMRETVSGNELG